MNDNELEDWLSTAKTDARDHRAPSNLAASIMENLATDSFVTNPLANLFDWLSVSFWRPTLAATLPLVFGFSLGLSNPATDRAMDLDWSQDLDSLVFENSLEEIAVEVKSS